MLGTEELTETIIDTSEKEEIQSQLVLFNDEVNTFDYIILCLIKVCKHDSIQAENCTMIAHNRGKCRIKKGSFDELEPVHNAMATWGVTTEIQ